MFFLSYNKPNHQKLASFGKFLLLTIFLAGIFFELTGCGMSRPIWRNHGDSCISVSKTPPLKRIINYTDHGLCKRKLSPRKAPNPQTRPTSLKD